MRNTVLNFLRSKNFTLLLKSLTELFELIFPFFLRVENLTVRSMYLLIRLRGERRKDLDNNYFIGAVPMDLSMVFHYIPHAFNS